MKNLTLLTLLLMAALSISACQAIGIGGKPAKTASPAGAGNVNEAYPSSAIYPSSASYPSAGAYPPGTTQYSNSIYPWYVTGMEIGWPQATTLITNGEVSKIMQTHDLKVTLSLKDGRTLITTETAIDEVMQLIQTCGDPCKSIQVTTE